MLERHARHTHTSATTAQVGHQIHRLEYKRAASQLVAVPSFEGQARWYPDSMTARIGKCLQNRVKEEIKQC